MTFFGKSHVGMLRQVNQDSFRCETIWNGTATLLVVCDGMGGHKAGEVASRNAVDIFCGKIAERPCREDKPDKVLEFVRYTMVCAASEANATLHHLSNQYEECHGMGTTLVALLVYNGWFYAINIGDSRLYLVTEDEVKLVTKDHSYVQYLIDNGKITPEEAKDYPRRNVITRAVGISAKLDVDFFSAPLEPWGSGYFLLCSDGLSGYMTSKVMLDILYSALPRKTPPEAELEKRADMLIDYANSKGGADNITAVLAKF